MTTHISARRPWIAGTLSTILPGLGHVYCGLFSYVIALMLASTSCSVFAIIFICYAALFQSTAFVTTGGILLALNVPIFV